MVIIDYYIHRYTHIDTVCEHGHCMNFEIDFYIWKLYNAGASRGQSLLGNFSLMFYNSHTKNCIWKGGRRESTYATSLLILSTKVNTPQESRFPTSYVCLCLFKSFVHVSLLLFDWNSDFFNFMLNLFLSLWNFFSNFKICYFDLFIYCSNMYYFT